MFRFELSDQAVYSITGSKQKFFESEQINISTEGKKEYEFMKVEMPIEEIIENKEYLLEEITFGINSNELDDASIASVQQVCKILRKNPTLSVEIGVHTDSRGSDEYNLTLSQKRANSILSVFQKLGIRDGRLKVKGYGETTLLNQCGNNVKCGSTAHNENRRVSMKILEF
jgi:peptidoglycan-associated lipoprotein